MDKQDNYMAQIYSDQFIAALEDYYVNTNTIISLEELARNSQELFGQEININALKSRALKGKWSIKRANKGRNTDEVPGAEKLTIIADKLYEMLVDDEDPLPKGQVAQVARTWLEMNVKTNISQVATAKTPAQTIKDMISESRAEELLDDNTHSSD